MINVNLFEDKKDVTIAKLRITIDKFKEYDKERSKLISDLQKEIESLKVYIQELEGSEDVRSLRKKINDQRRAINNLQTRLHATEKQLEKFYL